MDCRLEQQGMDFSIHIAELVRFLRKDREGFALTGRLLDCGTRAGFCCSAAGDAGMRREAREQAGEADYIIRMAVRAGYLTGRQGLPVLEECAALLAALEEAGDRTPGKGSVK